MVISQALLIFFNSYIEETFDFTNIKSDEVSSIVRELLLSINEEDNDDVILDKVSSFNEFVREKNALKRDFIIEEFLGYTLLGNIYSNNKDIF